MNKVKEEKEIKSAYKISLEIVNKTERGIFKSLDIFGLDLSFLKIKHIEFLPKLVQKIIVFLIQIITQFHQIIIKPFIITLYGVLVSIKDYYIKFTILLVIIMQIKKH